VFLFVFNGNATIIWEIQSHLCCDKFVVACQHMKETLRAHGKIKGVVISAGSESYRVPQGPFLLLHTFLYP